MASRRWTGAASPIAQVTTVTISDTWATGDTITLTSGNGNDLVVTVGSDSATTDVAAALSAAFNATDATTSLVDDESRNVGGQSIPEFTDITASVSGSVVTLTGSTAGRPFTVTETVSTAGDGDAVIAEATAATGPNHANNADNWSGNTLPVDNDTVIFDSGNIDVLYGLDQNGVTPAAIVRAMGYEGKVGLPILNEDDPSNTYPEYRDRYLKYGNSGDTTNTAIDIGQGDGNGSERFNLDSGTGQVTINVYNTGTAAAQNEYAFTWLGTHASNVVNVHRGQVGIAPAEDEAATVATLRVGYVDNQEGDATVFCGDGVTLTNIETVGGNLTIDDATTLIDCLGGTIEILSGAHAAINGDRGGSVYYRSTGTLTTAKFGNGARLDFSRDNRARTVTNCEINTGAILHDPFRSVVWTNGVDLYRASIPNVVIDLGTHLTLSTSNI